MLQLTLTSNPKIHWHVYSFQHSFTSKAEARNDVAKQVNNRQPKIHKAVYIHSNPGKRHNTANHVSQGVHKKTMNCKL